jgi:hypothetical protein
MSHTFRGISPDDVRRMRHLVLHWKRCCILRSSSFRLGIRFFASLSCFFDCGQSFVSFGDCAVTYTLHSPANFPALRAETVTVNRLPQNCLFSLSIATDIPLQIIVNPTSCSFLNQLLHGSSFFSNLRDWFPRRVAFLLIAFPIPFLHDGFGHISTSTSRESITSSFLRREMISVWYPLNKKKIRFPCICCC